MIYDGHVVFKVGFCSVFISFMDLFFSKNLKTEKFLEKSKNSKKDLRALWLKNRSL